MNHQVTDTTIQSLNASANELRAMLVIAMLLPGVDLGEDEEDFNVPGLYELLVPAFLSDAHAANCALDGFNSTVPVSEPWRFEFTVVNRTTLKQIERDDDIDYFEFEYLCGGVRKLSLDRCLYQTMGSEHQLSLL